MSSQASSGANLSLIERVTAVRRLDPYAEWSGENEPGSEERIVVRLFWRRTPLQTEAVRSVVRATAAGVLARLDEWDLLPTRPWLSAARSLAGAGLLPLPEGYEPPSHLRDFRRILPSHTFLIRAGLDAAAGATERDIGDLQRTLRWACDLLEAEAVLFLPSGPESEPTIPQIAEAGEPEIAAPPLCGKPHPLSDSEQKLARGIAADPGLAPLFAFNAPVQLGPLSRPCVDLLWESGKLVVEIDDCTHWHKVKYAADRQRDFELMAAGFLVLRITAEEVLQDMAKTLSKIRTCVDLRRTA